MAEFKCEHCGKIFTQEMSLRQHVSDKHTQKPVEQTRSVVQPVKEAQPAQENKKMKIKISSTMIYVIVAVVVVGAGGYGAYAYFSGAPEDSSGSLSQISAPIGALGSTHIHADFAVFLEGEQITPLGPAYFVRNAFVHVEEGAGAGSVIHMHATNVPLGFFFRSLGMSFNNECFTLDNGKEFCNSGNNTLKMFVKHAGGEWEQNKQYHTYVFQDLDKILITYGNETEEQVSQQQAQVTGFTVANSDRQMDLSNIPR